MLFLLDCRNRMPVKKAAMVTLHNVIVLCSITSALEVLGINPSSKTNKVNMNIGIRNDYLLTNCDDSVLKRSFPDLEYALLGYHILKGFPLAVGHDPGFTKVIFQANYSGGKQSADCKYSVPDGFTIIPDVSCQTSMTSNTVKNRQQLKSSMGVSAQISGGGWGLSFSASTAFNKMSDIVESGEKVIILSSATCQYYYSTIDEVNPPPLHPSFLRWVERLNSDDSTDEDYLDFLAYYGTHFMKSVTFGARFANEYSMNKSSYDSLKNSALSVEASASYSGFGVDVGGSFGYTQEQQEAISKFQEAVEKKTTSVGAPPPEDGDTMKWASTVKETPVPFKYEMESIEQLFTAPYMRRYPHINYNLTKHNLEYIKIRYAQEFFRRSLMNRICRVYNSVIQFKDGLCLDMGHYGTTLRAKNRRDCVQKALADRKYVALEYSPSSKNCWLYEAHDTNHVTRGGYNCSSMILPYRIRTTGSSYELQEIPGIMRVTGMRLEMDKDINPVIGSVSRSNCEKKCIENSDCVASYHFSNQCRLLPDSDIADAHWAKVQEDRDRTVSFIKTCQYV